MQKLIISFLTILILYSVTACTHSTTSKDNASVAAFPPPNYTLFWQETFTEFNSENWSKGLESDIPDAHITWNPTTSDQGLLNDIFGVA